MIYLLDMPIFYGKVGSRGSSCRLISQLTRLGSRPKNGHTPLFLVQLMLWGRHPENMGWQSTKSIAQLFFFGSSETWEPKTPHLISAAQSQGLFCWKNQHLDGTVLVQLRDGLANCGNMS